MNMNMKVKDFQDKLTEWDGFFTLCGVEKVFKEKYMEYVSNLISKGVPPIFDFQHLCGLLGVRDDFLAAAVHAPESFYRTFETPKRSGGKREITAPYSSLKYVQTWIYKNILLRAKVHGCAHGFVSKRSILTNAKIHSHQKCLLKMDLKDFFPSIPKEWVIQLFNSLGYEGQISYFLASLCCFENALPQGSPASPAISNIVAMHLDRRLYRLAKHFDLHYSRYADDIAFSGESIPSLFITYASDIITDCGFKVNDSKIRLYGEHGNKIITGISLATGVPRIPRDYRRRLEKELHYIDKYGLKGHVAHNKIRDPRYLESLIGRVGFWLMVEPDNAYARQMQAKLKLEMGA